METLTIIRSCHQSPVGLGCSSVWMRRTTIATQRGSQPFIARSLVMQTSGASTLANTRSPNLKGFPNKSGAICLTRYHDVIPDSTPRQLLTNAPQTKTIWLKFFGETLHANRSLARIALRASSGEEPTETQIVAKIKAIKHPGVRRALAEKLQSDIRRAFNCGEEVRSSLPSASPNP
jgi:hypothetical protein